VARQVERPRQLLEDAGARPELEPPSVELGAAAAFEEDDRRLVAARPARVCAVEALDAKREEAPARRLRRHLFPLARPQQQRHAGSTSTFTALPRRSSSTAAGSSSSPIRCVTSGSRSSRPCSSSRTASGKTS